MTPQPRRRRLEVEDIGDITVVNFVDKKILDEQNIQVIGEQLFSLVDELGRRKILLNFKNVEFLSSAALGKLITLNRKLQPLGVAGAEASDGVGFTADGAADEPLLGPARWRRRRRELAFCNSEYSSGGRSSGAISSACGVVGTDIDAVTSC